MFTHTRSTTCGCRGEVQGNPESKINRTPSIHTVAANRGGPPINSARRPADRLVVPVTFTHHEDCSVPCRGPVRLHRRPRVRPCLPHQPSSGRRLRTDPCKQAVNCLLNQGSKSVLFDTYPTCVRPQYAGNWYELKRYETTLQENGDCSTFDYSYDFEIAQPTELAVTARWSYADNTELYHYGTATLAGAANVGLMNVVWDHRADETQNYNIIATDYDNYAIIWDCQDLGNGRSNGKLTCQKCVSASISLRTSFHRGRLGSVQVSGSEPRGVRGGPELLEHLFGGGTDARHLPGSRLPEHRGLSDSF